MKKLLCTSLFCVSMATQAAPVSNFVGAFDIANWSTVTQAGSVDTSAAPLSISITGGDDGSGPSNDSLRHVLTEAGTLSFAWAYESLDMDPVWDVLGFLHNNVFTPLTDDLAGVSQSGTFSYTAALGDEIGFEIRSFDSMGGAATGVISAFSFVPTPPPPPPPGGTVSAPASLSLAALALATLAACSSRRHALRVHGSAA